MRSSLGKDEKEISVATGFSLAKVKQVVAYSDLSNAAKLAIDGRRFPLGCIDDLAAIPREQQPEMVDKLILANATKSHEVREGIEAHKNGRTYTAPVRKKALGRSYLKCLGEHLGEYETQSKEVQASLALISFVLDGTTTELEKFPTLWDAMKAAKKDTDKKGKGAQR